MPPLGNTAEVSSVACRFGGGGCISVVQYFSHFNRFSRQTPVQIAFSESIASCDFFRGSLRDFCYVVFLTHWRIANGMRYDVRFPPFQHIMQVYVLLVPSSRMSRLTAGDYPLA